jgi:hypothetical protein
MPWRPWKRFHLSRWRLWKKATAQTVPQHAPERDAPWKKQRAHFIEIEVNAFRNAGGRSDEDIRNFKIKRASFAITDHFDTNEQLRETVRNALEESVKLNRAGDQKNAMATVDFLTEVIGRDHALALTVEINEFYINYLEKL